MGRGRFFAGVKKQAAK